MDAIMDRIMTVPEVATYLQMSKSKVYYLIQRKEMPHIKIGRNVRIRQSDLEKWLTKMCIGVFVIGELPEGLQIGKQSLGQMRPEPYAVNKQY
jgi:excisionase family DNA binding protein